jgi:hypothetical protein
MSSESSGPPSTVPGVPQSGNAKYAVVALLLVIGTGALFAWRSLSSQTEPPAQVVMMSSASASATAATTSTLDYIPPPPKIDDKPESKPSAKVATGGGAAPAGGCDKTCTGAAGNDLTAALTMRGQQAKRCYNQALQNDSTLKGHVSISVRVGPSGNVCSAGVAANDMSTPAVANCAANMFRASSFPAPHGGCVDVAVPLSFVTPGN